MVKNTQSSRDSNKAKPRAGPSQDVDTSYIVFGDSAGDSKKSKKQSGGTAAEQTDRKGKGKDVTESNGAADAANKPTARALIGGASWTGKLPVNMLSEHCQKQKWEKPEYTMRKDADGFVAGVILKYTNPKTREVTMLPAIKMPSSHKDLATQPTAIEARHFAAAFTLFRVCSMKNIHMAMPPTFRDLWKGRFLDLKKQDIEQGKGYLYEADPFTAHKAEEEAKANGAKEKGEGHNQRGHKQNHQTGEGHADSGSSRLPSRSRTDVWDSAPQLEMGKRIRAEAEALIRRGASWNPNCISIDAKNRAHILKEVSQLGFRKSHVEEAVEICKDREEVLEWLLIHVPEDDLPAWTLPDGYVAGVSMASGNIKREAAVKRLAAAGYATEICEESLDSCNGDERRAAALLQEQLLGTEKQDSESPSNSSSTTEDTEGQNSWAEEIAVLESIYRDRFKSLSSDSLQIALGVNGYRDVQIVVQFWRPTGNYPEVLPILSILAPLPAYIRLSITRRALEHAKINLIGEHMMFSLVDWLEQEIPSIVERPGRLSDITSTASSNNSSTLYRRQDARSRYRPTKPLDMLPSAGRSVSILNQWRSRQITLSQRRMNDMRRSLPAWKLQDAIVDTVSRCQVVIISGETGSGKSTQSVQFILDDMIKRELGATVNILCTQPRRISAMGLADRVAEERCSTVGEEVGYIIRGESKRSPDLTKITFMTTGVLLRRLQTSTGRIEDALDALADVSHIFLDEVHERNLDTDFLLALLRGILTRRNDLKLILMSATLNADAFTAYFKGDCSVGKIEIEGRTHPVNDRYIEEIAHMIGLQTDMLDETEEQFRPSRTNTSQSRGMRFSIDYTLIANVAQYIDSELGDTEGGILIFLPGLMEIDRTIRALSSMPNFHCLPLHASLQPAEQRRVFRPPPKGKRKVIASTNVAETSITISDIVAVIDTGRVKETSFDPQTNMVKLEEVWASRAACKQRRGRAGRVREGNCYKLYSRATESAHMAEHPEPEIRRLPLEQLCLSAKAMGITDVPSFLANALTPPDSLAVEGAMHLLRRMGAIDSDSLTALGRHLSALPADLRCGKLLIYGSTFGCLESALTVAGILTARSPFVSPQDQRNESKAARLAFGKGQGDLICDLRAYEAWDAMKRQRSSPSAIRSWCTANFLSPNTLADISSNRSQYLSSLIEADWITPQYLAADPSTFSRFNTHNDNNALIRALLAASFSPQVARIVFPDKKYAPGISGSVEVDPEARSIKYFNQENGRVFVHPSSTLFDAQGYSAGVSFLSYWAKMQTSKVFVRELTPFNAYTLLLFCGDISVDTHGRGLFIDGWLRLRGWARIGALASRLRMMMDGMLARKINEPGLDISEDAVTRLVRRMVELNGLDQ